MKITPDASLFQALSNFPRVNREAINPTPGQAQGNTSRVSQDPQSAQAIRQKPATPARAQQNTSSTNSGQLDQNGNRSSSPYYREAPGVDQRPAFQRLGQIIDISV